jgi:hypothetical protein
MSFNLFKKEPKSLVSNSMHVSRVHVYSATDRPVIDVQYDHLLQESLHKQLLQGQPIYKTLWSRCVEKERIAINDRPCIVYVSSPKPLSINDLVEYVGSQVISLLRSELGYSVSQLEGRAFMASLYRDPKKTTSPDFKQLVVPWSQGSSKPDDKVDSVVSVRVVFFEE